jgi:hypothetical protein
MRYKAYSYISPRSPQKIYITPLYFFNSTRPAAKIAMRKQRPKQPYWCKPMGCGELKKQNMGGFLRCDEGKVNQLQIIRPLALCWIRQKIRSTRSPLTRFNQISGENHNPLTLTSHYPFYGQTRLVTRCIRLSMYDQALLMHSPP